VFTDGSGSGKNSLVFETIAAESQRAALIVRRSHRRSSGWRKEVVGNG